MSLRCCMSQPSLDYYNQIKSALLGQRDHARLTSLFAARRPAQRAERGCPGDGRLGERHVGGAPRGGAAAPGEERLRVRRRNHQPGANSTKMCPSCSVSTNLTCKPLLQAKHQRHCFSSYSPSKHTNCFPAHSGEMSSKFSE